MTLANPFTRKQRTLATIERTIEVGAFILLTDGRFGTLTSIDLIQGEKRGYVEGHGFAASVVDGEIFAFRNMELVQTAVA
jgi:hypothetical protein